MTELTPQEKTKLFLIQLKHASGDLERQFSGEVQNIFSSAAKIFDRLLNSYLNLSEKHVGMLCEELESLLQELETFRKVHHAPAHRTTIAFQKTLSNAIRIESIIKALERYVYLGEVKQEIESAKSESKKIVAQVESSKSTLQDVGAAILETHFGKAAREYKNMSIVWIAISFACFFFTIIAIYQIESELISTLTMPSKDPSNNLSYTISKFALYGFLFYICTFCTKNYLACSHNHAVNNHRATILKTFSQFTQSVGNDTSARDIILTHAVHNTFSFNETGFLKNSSHSNESIENIGSHSMTLNMLRQISGKES